MSANLTSDSFRRVFNSTRIRGHPFLITLHPSTRIFCGILLFLIVFLGVFGNGLVIAVLRRELKDKMIITYLLITHLCIADILGCVLDMPLLLVQFVFNIQDKLLHVISDVNFAACTAISLLNCLIINLMSLSRRDAFNVLSDPLLTVSRLNIILPITWIVCFTMGAVLGVTAFLTGRIQWYLQSPTRAVNIEASIIDIGSDIASVFCVLGTFITMTISFCFALRNIKSHNAMLQRAMIQSRLDLERKMSISALILTAAFLVSWMPWLIVRSLHLVTTQTQSDMAAIVTVIIGLNHCINPFVYAGTVSELRKKMAQFIKNSLKHPCDSLRSIIRFGSTKINLESKQDINLTIPTA